MVVVRSVTLSGCQTRTLHSSRVHVRRRGGVTLPNSADSADSAIPPNSESAWELLERFTRSEFQGTAGSTHLATKASRDKLREAFYVAIETPNESIAWKGPSQSPVLLGVLSSDIRLALRSLRDYTKAMGVAYVLPKYVGQDGTADASVALPALRGPVYVRFRALPDSAPQCTVSRYQGEDRGVLVNFGAMQVGHLPLGLLDEDKLNDEAM